MLKAADSDFKDLPPKKTANLYFFLVRILDILVAITGLIFSSPILLITALAIFIEDPHNPFYTPKRVGKNKKEFTFIKFRSMVHNAWELERKDKELMKKLRGGKHKVDNHPYVTKVGKFIRKYSIDELPQLVNVLLGQMSFVGPRALFPDEIQKFYKDHPDHKKYMDALFEVKPGITGYWQVNGRNKIDFDKRIRMEAWYARQYNIFYDLLIILKTPLAVLKSETS
jgi:lipopolysaccharide/colanic/teichoic acid biosynthesis glycosyltransferase